MGKPNWKEIGERIQVRRNQLKLTQEQICKELDTYQTYYSKIENGKVGISIEMLLKLCEALDVTSDYILTGQILNKNESLLVEYYNKLNEKQRHYITQHIKLFYEENLK
ncbi:MAG: helix-turn-helix transcriptional regulator [Clostridia bacterium]|nr:helix-turn-helix transcriptional regulator [Clostridia bacterium]